MTLTTGMPIFGKMSFAVLTIESGPRMSSSSARTIKVYGRLSATLTIHIQLLLRLRLQNRASDPILGIGVRRFGLMMIPIHISTGRFKEATDLDMLETMG